MKKPKLAAEKARARVQDTRDQIDRVLKAIKSDHPLDAEENTERKVRRFQAACGVNKEQAIRLAEYDESVLNSLAGERRLGAERIQGKTKDFVGVSFIELAKAASGTVARVVYRDLEPIGSGFMISDRLFLTNNHVIVNEEEAKNSLIEFNYEMDYNEQPKIVTRFSLDPDSFFFTSPETDLDFTIVAVGQRVSGQSDLSEFGYCPLLDSDDKHVLSEFVNIIQHPEGDYKQLVIRENRLVARIDDFLHYMTDTQPGSSGSPVFNDQWEVIALHHWGEPTMEFGADGSKVDRDVNEGVRISKIVSEIRSRIDDVDETERSLIRVVLEPQFRHPSPLKESLMPVTRPPINKLPYYSKPNLPEVKSDNSVTWKIPLEISVRIGDIIPPNITRQMEEPTVSNDEFMSMQEAITIDTNYENRDGFEPNFLDGYTIPLPKLNNRQKRDAARKRQSIEGEDPYELKYEHFSIVMNAKRRMAFFTSVNIDGSTLISVNRDTGEPRESEAEARERWYNDSRIDSNAQSDQSLYNNQEPKRLFDRGHLVRREDPNWGTRSQAKRANADTFHFTNCALQASGFNQGAELWAGIEKYILDNAKAERERVVVFTGPVFEEDDQDYRYTKVPKQFWKILVRVEEGQLLATALLADQSDLIRRLPERLRGERFDDISKVAQFQTSISTIESLTDLDFGTLREYDTFKQGPETLGHEKVKVTGINDIKLNR
jgi:endonuclease G, mitochondrial